MPSRPLGRNLAVAVVVCAAVRLAFLVTAPDAAAQSHRFLVWSSAHVRASATTSVAAHRAMRAAAVATVSDSDTRARRTATGTARVTARATAHATARVRAAAWGSTIRKAEHAAHLRAHARARAEAHHSAHAIAHRRAARSARAAAHQRAVAHAEAAAIQRALTAARTQASPDATVTAVIVAVSRPTTQPCGGALPPKSDGSTWTCSFDDEFSGRALDTTKWTAIRTADYGFHSGPECFVDRRANVSVSGGALNLTARRAAEPFYCSTPNGGYETQYTSGSVTGLGKFAQAYGRFSIRARFPAATVAGLQTSLWMWPVDPSKYPAWPVSGEIDIAEEYSQYADRAIPTLHYAPSSVDYATNINTTTNYYCTIADVAAFHTYTLEWTPTTMTISYDGNTCLIDNYSAAPPLTGSAPFDQPFFMILTQALGIGTNAFDPATTPLPATTQVDWVRVWK